MRKKIRRKSGRRTRRPADIANMTDDEVMNEMLSTGNGLFWDVKDGRVRPYSREVVEFGLTTLWDMWADIVSLVDPQSEVN
ncbi:MAG: hypothetical protein KC441_00970 [Anaerolineales bacterium]|nr:hypothetical protein [Anaerolineales bacterium]